MKKREGRFRAADGGTLFLDEIAELPLPAQAKLLRVLQDGIVEPLGTDTSVKVDVRLVSATHRNLREHVAKGSFREDLFYRINVLDVALPPLRDREGDLPLLIEFFLDGFAEDRRAGQPAGADAVVGRLRGALGLSASPATSASSTTRSSTPSCSRAGARSRSTTCRRSSPRRRRERADASRCCPAASRRAGDGA